MQYGGCTAAFFEKGSKTTHMRLNSDAFVVFIVIADNSNSHIVNFFHRLIKKQLLIEIISISIVTLKM